MNLGVPFGALAMAAPHDPIAALLADPELAALDGCPVPFDPLAALGWSHRERAYTRFLAWLLGARGDDLAQTHTFAPAMLRTLVGVCLDRAVPLPGGGWIALPRAPREVRREGLRVDTEAPVGDGVRVAARAPDLCCTFVDEAGSLWFLVIEAKVDADEGTGQVRAYLDWMRGAHPGARRVLAYVTPDGRSPEATPEAVDPVVSLRWGVLAAALLDALPPTDDDGATGFARAVLQAWRLRHGGDPAVLERVAGLRARHPAAVSRVTTPEPLVRALSERVGAHPRAVWHLRHGRPGARVWSRRWAEAVARAMDPSLPALVATAPHAALADEAAWMIAGITEALSLTLRCTPGRVLGVLRPRLWMSLYAPNRSALAAFAEREQLAALEALPRSTREALRGARPVGARGETWEALCVGDPVVAPEGGGADDGVARTAAALGAILRPHAEALQAFARDPEMVLFADDLDPLRVFPAETRDRAALAEEAGAEAVRLWILAEAPTGHPAELGRAAGLGRALTRLLGGTGGMVYELVPGRGERLRCVSPTAVVLDLGMLRAAGGFVHPETGAALAAGLAQGAALWVLGELPVCGPEAVHDPALRSLLGPLWQAGGGASLGTALRWQAGATRVRAWVTAPDEAPRVSAAGCARWWGAMVGSASVHLASVPRGKADGGHG